MSCGIPFCHTGCPVNNLIPDWNDLVSRDQWREALETLHSTNNFPEFHRSRLPRPLRGGLHPEPRRQPCDHQDHRMSDRRPRLERGLDRAPARGQTEWSPRRRRRLGTRGDGLRPATGARRSRGDGVRKERPDRRPASLRAFPTSRWRSLSSIAGSNRCGRRVSCSGRDGMSAAPSLSKSFRTISTPSSSPAARSGRATSNCRRTNFRASISPWNSWPSRTSGSPETVRTSPPSKARSAPRASTSW